MINIPDNIKGVDAAGIMWMAKSLSARYGIPIEDCVQCIIEGILVASSRDIEKKYSPANRLYFARQRVATTMRKQLGIYTGKPTPVIVSINDDTKEFVEPYYTQDLGDPIKSDAVRQAVQSLTPRQQRICVLLATGKRTKEICSEIGISHTWLRHEILEIRARFSKLGLAN